MKTLISTNIKFSEPKLEEEINQSLAQIEAEVLQSAKDNASMGFPKSNGDSFSLYFSVHHSKIQNLIDKVATNLQPRSTIASVVDHNKLTKDEVLNKNRAISDKQKESIRLKSAIKERSALDSYAKILLVHFIVGLIGITEAFFALPIFESFGYSKVESIVVALLYGLVLTVFAHFFMRIVYLGKTLFHRRLIACILALFTIGLFTFLASTRVLYIAESAKASGFTLILSPFPFILMASLILGIAISVVNFALPSKEDRARIKEQRDLIIKDRKIQNEIQKDLGEIEGKNQTHASLRSEQASKMEYGYSLEVLLTSKSEYFYNLFKIENQKHRNSPCDCLNEPYSLLFKYHFNNLLNRQTENANNYEN